MKKKAYILLGSNLGDREETLLRARRYLVERVGEIVQSSNIYETAAWGKMDQPAFLNQAVAVSTSLDAHPVLNQLHDIENTMGRKRKTKWGERTIDLDILLYENEIINDPILVVPHPGIANRRFTLLPLSEIAAHLVHPVLNKTMTQLLSECSDHLAVVPYVKKLQHR